MVWFSPPQHPIADDNNTAGQPYRYHNLRKRRVNYHSIWQEGSINPLVPSPWEATQKPRKKQVSLWTGHPIWRRSAFPSPLTESWWPSSIHSREHSGSETITSWWSSANPKRLPKHLPEGSRCLLEWIWSPQPGAIMYAQSRLSCHTAALGSIQKIPVWFVLGWR